MRLTYASRQLPLLVCLLTALFAAVDADLFQKNEAEYLGKRSLVGWASFYNLPNVLSNWIHSMADMISLVLWFSVLSHTQTLILAHYFAFSCAPLIYKTTHDKPDSGFPNYAI